MTAREARLLSALMTCEALSLADINIILTDDPADAGGGMTRNTIRVMIGRMRKKLQAINSELRILSVWGGGYRINMHV